MNYRIYLNGGLQFSGALQTSPCSVETSTFEVWSEQLNIYTHAQIQRQRNDDNNSTEWYRVKQVKF